MGFTQAPSRMIRRRSIPDSLFSIRPVRHRTDGRRMVRCGPMMTCQACGKQFQAWNNQQAESGRAKYCSRACYYKGISQSFYTPPSTLEQRREANAYINNEIAAGRLARALVCEECPNTENVDAHHDDYAAKDKVRWLCRSCHMTWHFSHPDVTEEESLKYPTQPQPTGA